MAIRPKRMNSVGRVSRARNLWQTDIFDLLAGNANSSRKIPLRELSIFCREAAFLLEAGLPIKEAMPVLAQQTSSRTLETIVSNLHSLIMQGESFSHALRVTGVFPEFMCGYIAIGERTANLPNVCSRLADYFEARAKTREELASALAYPIMVSVMMLAVIVLAITFVLPGYARIFAASDVALPAATAVLLSVSGFLSANAIGIFLLFFAMITISAIFFRTGRGQAVSAHIKLKIPVLRKHVNCNFTQGLSLLLGSGLSVSEAIPMCGEITDNSVVKRDFEKLSAAINSGVAFWTALNEISYINPLAISLARVGETTGNLPQTMEKCNAYLEDAYRREIHRLNKLLTPILTLVIGLILAAVMLAIIVPTFELATAI